MGLLEYAGAGTSLSIDVISKIVSPASLSPDSKSIFGNASVDPEGYLSSEELSFNENLEVSAKIFATKAPGFRL